MISYSVQSSIVFAVITSVYGSVRYINSILFFLQGHHCVLQPAVHLHLFFGNALHGVLSFEAARSVTQIELSHPFTDRQNSLHKDHKQNSINTPDLHRNPCTIMHGSLLGSVEFSQ